MRINHNGDIWIKFIVTMEFNLKHCIDMSIGIFGKSSSYMCDADSLMCLIKNRSLTVDDGILNWKGLGLMCSYIVEQYWFCSYIHKL